MIEVKALNHPIYIGEEAASQADRFIQNRYSNSRKYILVDENTLKHCLDRIRLLDSLRNAEIIEIESGEENKVIEIVYQLWETLIALEADRYSLFINLGGGVISDMGGFVASTFKRGIDFINFPTTLLSQVDASVGGKLGVNFGGIKNQIGLFKDPVAVFVDPNFLTTLDDRQILSGYAEVIKHGLISGKIDWELIKQLRFSSKSEWSPIIEESIKCKNEIVSKDPVEHGLRKVLNFGHTIGHALESWSHMNGEDPLLHGEAVAIGMVSEVYLSFRKGYLTLNEAEEIGRSILSIFKKYKLKPENYPELLDIMLNDKKNVNNIVHFTLLKRIGEPIIDQKCSTDEITDSLNFYRSL